MPHKQGFKGTYGGKKGAAGKKAYDEATKREQMKKGKKGK